MTYFGQKTGKKDSMQVKKLVESVLDDGNFQNGISDWETFTTTLSTSGTATSVPSNLTGGSSSLVLSHEQYSNYNSLKIVKDAANREGEGFSCYIPSENIPATLYGKRIEMSFEYSTTENFVFGDLEIWLQAADVPNICFPVQKSKIEGGSYNKHRSLFYFYGEAKDYYIGFVIPNSNTNAWDMEITNVQVKEIDEKITADISQPNHVLITNTLTPLATGRYVWDIDLGKQMLNRERLLVSFSTKGSSSNTDDKILGMFGNMQSLGILSTDRCREIEKSVDGYFVSAEAGYDSIGVSAKNTMLVSKNYKKAMYFGTPFHSISVNYGTKAASSYMPMGAYTYEDIGVGVLVGWYLFGSVMGNPFSLYNGVSGVDHPIELESAWLEESGGTMHLMVALNNRGLTTAPETDYTFKILCYD